VVANLRAHQTDASTRRVTLKVDKDLAEVTLGFWSWGRKGGMHGNRRVVRSGVLLTRGKGLRFALVCAVLVATTFLAASARASSRSETSLQTLNRKVLASVNRFRASHGLVALRESAALDRAARRHSLEMGRVGYFGHDSAGGTQFWQRIRHFYPARGYSYWAAGENLVWASPSLRAGGAMRLWISSPPHLANLLSHRWRQIGISAVGVVSAPGVYGGRHVTIITTDFGVRH
jgi:uncharacterized protein YkwD